MSQPELVDISNTTELEIVHSREDSANEVTLRLGEDDQHMVVTVQPLDTDALPFGVVVNRVEANEAFIHPYPYMYAALAGRTATSAAVEIAPAA